MDIQEVRSFRRHLRQFERVTHAQLKGCCAEVTLAQCLVLLEIDENAKVIVASGRLDDGSNEEQLARTHGRLVKPYQFDELARLLGLAEKQEQAV